MRANICGDRPSNRFSTLIHHQIIFQEEIKHRIIIVVSLAEKQFYLTSETGNLDMAYGVRLQLLLDPVTPYLLNTRYLVLVIAYYPYIVFMYQEDHIYCPIDHIMFTNTPYIYLLSLSLTNFGSGRILVQVDFL